MPHPLETFMRDVRQIHGVRAAMSETSFYSPIANLLNEVGDSLAPKVRCIMQLRNVGGGIPDGGLFTQDQLRRVPDDAPMLTLLPSRGAIEVKSPAENLGTLARSEQVARYVETYGQVLITNLRSFALVGRQDGRPVIYERYDLAESEVALWSSPQLSPLRAVELHGERFVEYLKRVMLQQAALASPKDVAWFLASYARDAMLRIEQAPVELGALANLRQALEDSLGLTFEGERGDHFFRSTLVQTLFYGVFSGWVLWSARTPASSRQRFDWKDAGWELQVPVIRALFHQISNPQTLKPLRLDEVLDWAGSALNRVDRTAFFEKFEEDLAVQHFYEPFLEAFDPNLRRQMGVWYTPKEVVQYMVARVDTVLREELGIAGGLADESVYILDPATGTGSYLVEVVRLIDRRLREHGGDALTAHDVKQAAMTRVLGFELLPAPFVVAHLQLGLLLKRLGAPLSDEGDERVGVYLTNALTGWDAHDHPRQRAFFEELEAERTAADGVKRATPILVILGNPPYNGYAGIAMEEERDLTDAYRTATRTRQPQGQGLNDLYVRFFRMAERKIVEGTGRGIVCYISNYSWLDGLSHTAMRERYLDAFDRIWIDNLHGDRIISEYAPDGRSSETIFATHGMSVGIKVGTSIALALKRNDPHREQAADLLYRDMDHARADERRDALVESLRAERFNALYMPLAPVNELGLPFKPRTVTDEYLQWPLLPDLFPTSFPGVKTSRDDVVVDIDRDRLVERMQAYFDPKISHYEMRTIAPGAMEDSARFPAEDTRDVLRRRGIRTSNIVRYFYRPFDVRWLYWEPDTKLLDEKRPEYFPHVFSGNVWIEARQRQPKERFDRGVPISVLADNLGNGLSNYFPMMLRNVGQASLFGDMATNGLRPNISESAQVALAAVSAPNDVASLFFHTVAVLHAPAYRDANAGALRQDWPRIPLPDNRERLEASAALGRQVAALLDTEQPVDGVTSGAIRPDLRVVGSLVTADGAPLGPNGLRVTAGWGRGGRGGITMPGRGKSTERDYTTEERNAIEAGAAALGLDAEEAFRRLGETTRDVWLNERVYWRNVPERVWTYTIGGYQVMKKWLSYREAPLLGRNLRNEEAREVQAMARRIAAILLLEPALDANYAAVTAATYAWPGT